MPRVCGSTGPDTRSKQKDQPEKCRYFPTAPQCESPRCAAVGGFAALRMRRTPCGCCASRTPCEARLCGAFDFIRGGLCPLELPLCRTVSSLLRIVLDTLKGRPAGRPFQRVKSLAEFRRPQAAEENEIVFPAACTSEKHFARSERRRTRQGPRRRAERILLLAEKALAFFDSLKRPPRGAALFVREFTSLCCCRPRCPWPAGPWPAPDPSA